MAAIHSLVTQPEPTDHDQQPYRYNRVPVERVTLRAGHGIEGDHKAGHNPNRHLNIMTLESLQTLEDEGWRIDPGALGEQIVVTGLDVQALPSGSRIQLGDSAVVEVNMLRTGCSWLKKVQEHDPDSAAGRLGVMGSVITGGEVRVGSPVTVVFVPEGA